MSNDLKERLRLYPGVYDIKDSFQYGKEELQLKIKVNPDSDVEDEDDLLASTTRSKGVLSFFFFRKHRFSKVTRLNLKVIYVCKKPSNTIQIRLVLHF